MFIEDKTFWIIAVLVVIVIYLGFMIKKRSKGRRATTHDFENV